MTGGWGGIGAALAGGGGTQNSYNRGALQGADLQNKLAEARKAVQEGISREALALQLEKGGDGELAGAIRASIDPRQIGGYRKYQQDVNFGNQSWQTANSPTPDLELLNRQQMVRAGKPVDLTKIEGGVAYSPQMLPGNQTISPTAVGQSEIAARLAQANQSNAGAAENMAHAGLYNVQAGAGGFAPSSGLSGRGHVGTASIADALAGPDPTQPRGPEAMNNIDPAMRPIVQAVIDGRYPVPTGRAATSPEWMAVVQAATQVDPDFDAGNYPARAAAHKDLTGAGAGVKQIQSLNTLAAHIAGLEENTAALGNRSFGPWNHLANSTMSMFGQSAPTKYAMNADSVATEIATALKGGPPTQGEINEWRHKFDVNAGPNIQNDALKEAASLVEGRLQAVQERANQALGSGAKNIQVTSPAAQALFQRLSGGHGQLAPSGIAAHGVPAHAPGDIITVQGRQYRVKGGDPNDPDLEAL